MQTQAVVSSSKEIGVGDLVVNKKYTIIQSLHEGPNSKINAIGFMKNSRQVTRILKTETQRNLHQGQKTNKTQCGLKYQISVLRRVLTSQNNQQQTNLGFPKIYESGNENFNNYLVMEMYGPSLQQLLRLCGGKFSTRTAVIVGMQILDRIAQLHEKRYLYRNIRPENFVIGLGKFSYLIYMLDFEKCLKYKSHNKNVHIPYENVQAYSKGPRPDYREHIFSSLNQQLGIQSSRRDDIQSLMYLIIFMIKGKLPWCLPESMQHHAQGQKNNMTTMNTKFSLLMDSPYQMGSSAENHNAFNQNFSYILEIKRKLSICSLMKGMSFELIDVMYYAKALNFYEKPDYEYLKKKFWNALMETDYQELLNNVIIYDWNLKEPIDFQIYRDVPLFKIKKIADQVEQNDHDCTRSIIEVKDGKNKQRKISENLEQPRLKQKQKSTKQVKKVDISQFDLFDEANIQDDSQSQNTKNDDSTKNQDLNSKSNRLIHGKISVSKNKLGNGV